ncbi:thyrotropin releasing hormone isoform X1 [Hirundo rustica]|nr:thyrotropin releasing hormone isoform X1 [Hirundo rustica]XP_039932051.1 thyrotropin releasing hormone isoform X1 [Hirundo rustica]XP_039932052.1 thyrotropin releasing hormone isoform X1 [Hirundo rustica]XP_039932053.1 thyrotropin releasing hormone isoform X1 [Hirundo rustica]XP_039932054.1 thyrotropin releasing hormone isoform X1 [Hirundo rustica]XP_039932055.1 thyrotropin releasing hormone isoform X1 [Hirundo rustica]XP_039932057.1 thyrotropin releasing hormone isoform X1 [Hirundo rustic
MPSIQLPLLLLCLTSCGVCFNGGHLPEESENMGKSLLNDTLQGSESLILQSALKKAEKEEEINKESNTPLLQWLSKRQHPGKKYLSNLEKRQHPGKRDVEEETSYGDIQKRQHPGKREMEDDLDVYLELKRQQPPGRKSLLDQSANSPRAQPTYMSESSKREHPGRRYPMYKHQHPSKRGWNYEVDLYGEKRQHPGKRYWNSDSSDDTGPCNFQEPFTCHKGRLLLDLVEDVSRDRVEEKRQHQGKRSAWETEAEE